MKLKYNVLQQENDELQSKLDMANKEVNDYKIFAKKSRELKDRKQHDTAKVCMYIAIAQFVNYCTVAMLV